MHVRNGYKMSSVVENASIMNWSGKVMASVFSIFFYHLSFKWHDYIFIFYVLDKMIHAGCLKFDVLYFLLPENERATTAN